jgi:hypothetical protein
LTRVKVRGLLLVVLASVVLSVARTVVGGQDQSLDFLSSHFYLGYSAFHDRLNLDFLAAGVQTDQSFLPYALLYLLDSWDAPPIVNAGLHACLHAFNLVALFGLTRLMLRGTSADGDRVLLAASWLLGAIAPIYWYLVGTSSADLLTSALVLGGLWLVSENLLLEANAVCVRMTRFAAGAALIGAAVAVRPADAMFAAALACALALVRFGPLRARLRALGVFACAAVAAWLLCFGPHAWALHREFGNPVFPWFNALFRSPDFPPANLPLGGFAPESIVDALTLPFRIARHALWVYADIELPDVRPAMLVAAALAATYRRAIGLPGEQAAALPGRSLVLVFFAFAALLWVATSADGRSGVALFLLAGPVCGALLQKVLPRRYVLLAIGAALAWQAAVLQVFFKQERGPSGPWSQRYFDWDVAPSVAREPAVYLSFGYNTASSFAPRVHPASRHVNLVGEWSLDVDSPGAGRLRRILDTPGMRLYGVFDFYYTQQPDPAARSIKVYFREHVRRWGLDFTAEPCTLMPLRPPDGAWPRLNELAEIAQRGKQPEFIRCELRAAAAKDRDAALAEYRHFRQKLAPFIAACPRILGPAVTIVRVPGQWLVASFASLEHRLDFADQGSFFLRLMRPPYSLARAGEVSADAIVPKVPDCNRWFTRLVH